MDDFYQTHVTGPDFVRWCGVLRDLEVKIAEFKGAKAKAATAEERKIMARKEQEAKADLDKAVEKLFNASLLAGSSPLAWITKNRLSGVTTEELRQAGLKQSAEALKGRWRKEIIERGGLKANNLLQSSSQTWGLDRLLTRSVTSVPNMSHFPPLSFFLTFEFSLQKPYLSKDDELSYMCENPVKKEKVSGVPMISASTWKGNMRWTAMKLLTDQLSDTTRFNLQKSLEWRSRLVRLFGHEKERVKDYLDETIAEKLPGGSTKANKTSVDEGFDRLLLEKRYRQQGVDGRKGRLTFFPTFFDRLGLEIINPHDRETRAGKVPVYLESVPSGAKGSFKLLYVPFDLISRAGDSSSRLEIVEDLKLVYGALGAMMITYGFSAKKSTGYGKIDGSIAGAFDMSLGAMAGRNGGNGESGRVNTFSDFTQLEGLMDQTIRIIKGEKRDDK